MCKYAIIQSDVPCDSDFLVFLFGRCQVLYSCCCCCSCSIGSSSSRHRFAPVAQLRCLGFSSVGSSELRRLLDHIFVWAGGCSLRGSGLGGHSKSNFMHGSECKLATIVFFSLSVVLPDSRTDRCGPSACAFADAPIPMARHRGLSVARCLLFGLGSFNAF